ncbi:MAG: type VI secretion system tube protein Hcp [Rudaea sp.]
MGGWIKISGIRGESQDPAHFGWIEIESMSWGAVTHRTGARSEKPATSEIVVTKKTDSASASLMRAGVNGPPFGQVTIDIADGAGKTQASFQLKNVVISSMSLSSASGSSSSPMESITLNFTDAAVTQGASSAGASAWGAFSSATSAIAKAIGEALAQAARKG